MKRLLFCFAVMFFACSGCSDRSPIGPSSIPEQSEAQPPPPAPVPDLVTIQGRIYARVTWGDPLLAGALILVRNPAGFERAETTDADGFYEVAMPPGVITITASKEGYQSKSWEFLLSNDTVLNFGLTPK